jgi:hypothetical protein
MRKFLLLCSILFLVFNCTKKVDNKVEEQKETTKEVKINKCVVTSIEGEVFLTNENNTDMTQISVGDNLKENDSLKTETNSTVELQLGNDSIIRVKENSILKIAKLFRDGDNLKTNLFLKNGKILAKPEKQTEGSSFEIQTDSITAGVRGTEFVVVSDEKSTKVAVNEGIVKIKSNVDIESIDKLVALNSDLASKIKTSGEGEVEITADQKIIVNVKDVKKLETTLSSEVNKIIEKLGKNKDSKDLENVIKQIENQTINEISVNSSRILQKEDVTKKEWEKEYNKKEFEEMKSHAGDVSEDKKESTKENAKSENKPKELTRLIKKTGNAGAELSEKTTSITGTDGNLIISSDTSKSIISFDPENGKLNWKFSSAKIKTIFSPAIFIKNDTILGTSDSIFVLNSSGNIKQTKEISNGPSFWSSPVIGKGTAFIPTTRTIFTYDGNEIGELKDFPAAQGQLYLSYYDNALFIVDSLYFTIRKYDLKKNEVTWTSDKLQSRIYTTPAFSGKYFFVADSAANIYKFDYESGNTKPETTKIPAGVTSNMIAKGNNVFFVANDGCLYKVNDKLTAGKIEKVDSAPDANKYLIKKILLTGNDIYFSSDTGKIYHYDISKNNSEFIDIPANKKSNPLVGTPIKVNDEIFVVDTDSNVYKISYVYQ